MDHESVLVSTMVKGGATGNKDDDDDEVAVIRKSDQTGNAQREGKGQDGDVLVIDGGEEGDGDIRDLDDTAADGDAADDGETPAMGVTEAWDIPEFNKTQLEIEKMIQEAEQEYKRNSPGMVAFTPQRFKEILKAFETTRATIKSFESTVSMEAASQSSHVEFVNKLRQDITKEVTTKEVTL